MYDIYVALIIWCNFTRHVCYKYFFHGKTSRQELLLVAVFIFLEFFMLVFHLNILMLGIDSEAECRFLIIIRKLCSI